MRYLTFLLISLLTLTSCNDTPVSIKNSAGKMNDILVVIEDDLWEGMVGDSIRSVLAIPVDGLVREEPQFTLNQIKPSAFNGDIKKTRNYLKVELSSEKTGVNVTNNLYSNPQTGVVIRANDTVAISSEIHANAEQIRTIYRESEIKEKVAKIRSSRLNTDIVKNRLGIDISVPFNYRYAAENDEDFFWLRRNIKEGTLDLMLYDVPREAISRENYVADIVKVRDSIGAMKIPVADNGVFMTEEGFSPFVNESQIDGRFAYETKGIWIVKNTFMSGPFLNYAIYNKKKDNWIIVEGYIFAPSASQRNYLFEIEAILKSIKIVD